MTTETTTAAKPTVITTPVFVDSLPGSKAGRAGKYDAAINAILPALNEHRGQWAAFITDATNSAVTNLNKAYADLGLRFSFRADDNTDGKRGTVYVQAKVKV